MAVGKKFVTGAGVRVAQTALIAVEEKCNATTVKERVLYNVSNAKGMAPSHVLTAMVRVKFNRFTFREVLVLFPLRIFSHS